MSSIFPNEDLDVRFATQVRIDSDAEEITLRLPKGTSMELAVWWFRTAARDFDQGAPKVDEYGAHDLEIMGVVLLIFSGMEKTLANPQSLDALPVGTELACWFYVLGKVARLVSDYLAKRPGKADTWHDITFYSMMARRIQETGRWP